MNRKPQLETLESRENPIVWGGFTFPPIAALVGQALASVPVVQVPTVPIPAPPTVNLGAVFSAVAGAQAGTWVNVQQTLAAASTGWQVQLQTVFAGLPGLTGWTQTVRPFPVPGFGSQVFA
jgi:hypothetical protein